MKSKIIFLFAAAITFSVASCETSSPQAGANSSSRSGSGKKSISVQLFSDSASIGQKMVFKKNGQIWRTNGREAYPNGQIAPRISKIVAQELRSSGVFSRVSGPGNSGADYLLKGTISEYHATGKVNIKAEQAIRAGAAAGAVGSALAGVGQRAETTSVFSEVVLTNVRVIDAKTGRIVWTIGRVASSSSQAKTQFLKSDSDVLLRRADWELRRALEKLTASLKRSNL